MLRSAGPCALVWPPRPNLSRRHGAAGSGRRKSPRRFAMGEPLRPELILAATMLPLLLLGMVAQLVRERVLSTRNGMFLLVLALCVASALTLVLWEVHLADTIDWRDDAT